MIRSFADRETRELFEAGRHRKYGDISRIAFRKLRQINEAESLEELRYPPGNRLELLRGDRAGQYSIRVNDQFRVCFRWSESHADDVEIVDYH